jgi:uncharacterized protein (UPF0332 family)
VREAVDLTLERARQELQAAETLLDAGFPAQAVSRAYLAGLHAASAALTASGERPATRVGVISAFGRMAAGTDGLDHEAGRILRRLYEDRIEIDYGLAEAPLEGSRRAVADAERLVEAAARWIALRSERLGVG